MASATAAEEEGAGYELRPDSSQPGEPPSCSRPVEVAVGGDGDADATVTFRQAGFRVTPRAAGGSAPFPLRFRAVSDDGGAEEAAFLATGNHRGSPAASAAAPAALPPAPQSLFSWILAGLARAHAAATARGLLTLHDAPMEGIRTAAAFVSARARGVADALRSVISSPADAPAVLLQAVMGLPAPSSDDAASPTLHGPASDFRSWLLDDPHARRRRRFAELRSAAAGQVGASPASQASSPRFVRLPAGAAGAEGAPAGGGVCLPTLRGDYSLDVPRLPCLAIEPAVATGGAAAPVLAAQPLRWRAAWNPDGGGGVWGASPALRISGWWAEGSLAIGQSSAAAAAGEGGGARALCAALAAATAKLAALRGGDEAAVVAGRLLALSPPPPFVLGELREACGVSVALPASSAPPDAAAPRGLSLSVDYEPLLRALRAAGDAPPALPVELPVRVGSPLGFGVRLSLCGGQPVEVATAAAPTAAAVAAGDLAGQSGEAAPVCPSPLPVARGC